ncbi:hypothetical protein WK24_17205 [Burkholderia vietnamiensis]|nr:hypothetical protein WK23_27565 [Burkholderia vietnamiensis]AOK13959.1 hypothetical protein WK31_27025 [Burkholderia vietnamiensis]KVE17232.1 hypothetical protein WI92_05380 [Burkholderia vietnamiensis]KVE61068.1 hypothetical protein WI96_25200 [Burkholderia vietnamiensis]KVF12200.1 hypothetical protein WJ05_02080 [Burkholderia vietnamiensis]
MFVKDPRAQRAGNQAVGPAVEQDVSDLLGFEERIDGNEHVLRGSGTQYRHDGFDTFVQIDRNARAGRESKCVECIAHAARAVNQVLIGYAGGAADERFRVGRAVCCSLYEVEDVSHGSIRIECRALKGGRSGDQ